MTTRHSIGHAFAALWQEPPAPGAEPPSPRDWALVALIVIASLAEGLLRDDLTWRWLAVCLGAGLAFALPWRRSHPLMAVMVAFGSTGVVQALALLTGADWAVLDTSGLLVILPYALLRWASGRDVVVGLIIVAIAFALSAPSTGGVLEAVAASLFLLFPAALGAAVRFRDRARRQALDDVRLRERARLARELHDTVAHHVSAIAVQAQAGRALVSIRPEAPLQALEVIEEAASRTLSDMRQLVQALRGDEDTDHSPGPGLEDLRRLGKPGTFALQVDVELSGMLENVQAAQATTLYRLAREALTNAVRHARSASRVSVRIVGEPHALLLRVSDDGVAPDSPATQGFGLRGMAERVALQGGTLHAGPGHLRGWCVEVQLPRNGGGS